MCLSASVADFVVVLGDGCGACSAGLGLGMGRSMGKHRP